MSLIGDTLNWPDVNAAIQSLTQLVGEKNSAINEVKSPASDLAVSYGELIESITQVRGRGLFYPYIGSGAGNGPYVELRDGSIKLDLINGIGVHILGHSHPRMIEASLHGSIQDVVNQGNLQPNSEYLALGKKLTDMASRHSRLKHVWLSTSGSMANENALKMCRQKKSPAKKVIAMKDAFAGRTTMMAEITDNPNYKQGLPEYHEVLRVPFATTNTLKNCAVACKAGCRVAHESEAVIALLTKYIDENPGDIACFSFEPMLGEGGYKVACTDFFIPILRFLRENEIPIWADEVQTFGRTGELFAFETLKIGEFIDVVTIAKTLQVAATLYTEEFNPKPGLVAGTFSGTSPALASGLAMIEELESGGYLGTGGKIDELHNSFIEMLNRLKEGSCKGMLKDPGGLGLMIAVTPFNGEKEHTIKLLHKLYDNGLIAFGCGKIPFRVRFLLPAILNDDHIAEVERILEKSLHEVAKEINWSS
jgi:4-aminobutyrate aminotransferase-like enzyme